MGYTRLTSGDRHYIEIRLKMADLTTKMAEAFVHSPSTISRIPF